MGPPRFETWATILGRVYDDAIATARAVARESGYALAVHGSTLRDLDLVAVPWHEDAITPDEVAEKIRAAVGGVFSAHLSGEVVTERPHGRKSWAIHLPRVDQGLADAMAASKGNARPYIDLSVMPLR